MKAFVSLFLFLLLTLTLFSQVAINTDGTAPDGSAMLDIKSTVKGMLVPRMTSGERVLISSPANGLLVFQTDPPSGFFYYSTSGWQMVGGSGLVGSGSAGSLAFWSSGSTLSGNTGLSWDNTNSRLGIGTTSPAQKLTVDGTLGIIETGTSPVYHTIIQGGNQSADISYTLPASAATLSGQVLTSSTGGVLSWSSTEAPLTFQNGLTRTTNTVELGGALLGSTSIIQDGSEALTFTNSGSSPITFNLSGTGDFRILDNSSTFFYATDEGKIGIGTSSPNEQLEITGNLRIPASTSTTGIIYAGPLPWIHTVGSSNNFFGQLSGNLALSGADNNSAVGDSTLYSITTGDRNLAIGTGALKLLTSATGNIGIGYRAGWKMTNVSGTGGYNTMVGYQAGLNNNGNRNTFLGCEAGYSNTVGIYNTFVGHQSGYYNTIADNSVAIGYRALFNQDGTGGYCDENVAVGFEALFSNSNTTENEFAMSNVAVGYQALRAKTSGSSNTAIGSSSLKSSLEDNDNTAVGSRTMEVHISGNSNTAIGKYALGSSLTGHHNTAVGALASSNIEGGYNNTSLGTYSGPVSGNLFNTIAIGYDVSVNASNKAVIGNSSITTIGGYGAWTNYSDRRLKENITYRTEPGLDFIMKLRPATYNYILDENKRRRNGLIAQDVQEALESLNVEFSGLVIDDDPDKTMNLSYNEFVIPLINAVQEQQRIIENLKDEVTELKQKLENINKD